MTDLVERLRQPVMLHTNAEQTNAERREAATEIADLRAKNEHLTKFSEDMDKWNKELQNRLETSNQFRADLADEVDRLRRGIELFLSGDQPRPPCNHGVDDISDCWICADHYFQKLIALEQDVKERDGE